MVHLSTFIINEFYVDHKRHKGYKYNLDICKDVRELFRNQEMHDLTNDMSKLRQCNYTKCKTIKLKRFKICKRCKNVIHCNGKQQKLDWRYHKKECVYNAKRSKEGYRIDMFSVFQQRSLITSANWHETSTMKR